MKLKVNPMKMRELTQEKENKEIAKNLEELNWKIQEKQFEIGKLQTEYELQKMEYLKRIGYEFEEKDEEMFKRLTEEYNGYGEAIC